METKTAQEILFSAPIPEKTESYTPISHKEIDDKTREIIQKKGFTLVETRYNSSADGKIGQCQYNIQYGDDPEMGLMIAWQNSYNKLISFKYAIGAYVMVCSNGCVSGDLGAYRRKHTGDADHQAFTIIESYLNNAENIFKKLVADREHLKQIKLSTTRMAELMGKMFVEKDIITSTQINIMKRELENPTYDYSGGGDNAWALYNYATHAFKEDSPRSWIKRHIDLHNFFADEFAIPKDESSEYIPDPVVEMVSEETVVEEKQLEMVEETKYVPFEEPKSSSSMADFLDDF